MGYNLLDGNPEGSAGLGGLDPGIRDTHRVLQLTYKTRRLTLDRSFSIPDQVTFTDRWGCASMHVTRAYAGPRGYQKSLQSSVDASGSNSGLWSFSFTMSSRYQYLQQRYKHQRDIVVEKTRVCNLGTARYERERASEQPDFKLEDGFPAAVSGLPSSYNSSTSIQYGRFLDEWGTHVVTGIKVGSKYTE